MDILTTKFQKMEMNSLGKCAKWREFWKWPEFRSLTHQATLLRREPCYSEELMTELELAEKIGGPSTVRGLFLSTETRCTKANAM